MVAPKGVHMEEPSIGLSFFGSRLLDEKEILDNPGRALECGEGDILSGEKRVKLSYKDAL